MQALISFQPETVAALQSETNRLAALQDSDRSADGSTVRQLGYAAALRLADKCDTLRALLDYTGSNLSVLRSTTMRRTSAPYSIPMKIISTARRGHPWQL